MNKETVQQVLRFGGVGSIGFVVDGGLLWLFITLRIDPYYARLASFPIAVLVTWWLNRIWTFEGSNRAKPLAQFNRYMAIQIVGALTNYAVYALYLWAFDATFGNAMIGFVFGSALGMFVNFFGVRHLVFKT